MRPFAPVLLLAILIAGCAPSLAAPRSAEGLQRKPASVAPRRRKAIAIGVRSEPAALAENQRVRNRDGYEDLQVQRLLRPYWTSELP